MLLAGDSLVISEFLAVNDTILQDVDGDYPDWIEVHNPTNAAVNLEDWSLTDDASELMKWQFPDVSLDPGEYLVVFASDKDRSVAGAELHTNFKLTSNGEYLALVEPDGLTVAHEYAPAFPEQYPDISYGLTQETGGFTIATAAELTYLVPPGGSLGTTWTAIGFDDSAWTNFAEGLGVLITEAGSNWPPHYVEIQNTSADPIDTSGWVVAVNQAGSMGDVNLVHTTLWELPDSMGADEVLYRTDDPNDVDHYWGENILWVPRAFGWAMMLNDLGGIVDFIAWGYDEAEIASMEVDVNGFENITVEGAWSGPGAPAEGLPADSLQRGGEADHNDASDWTLVSPKSQGEQNENLNTPFVTGLADAIGFDAGSTGIGAAVQVDVEAEMHNVGASLYARYPFYVDSPSAMDEVVLRIKHNDGFVAYINGQEVARRYAPTSPEWNSTATTARSVEDSLAFELIDISDWQHVLQPGTNLLAIHGLNVSAADDNFLIQPDLFGSTMLYFSDPTPGAPNTTQAISFAKETSFSVDHGFFQDPFTVEIATETPAATIRYTTDGGQPTGTSGTVYSGPISISGTTVLRAATFKMGHLPSTVRTRTYLFLDDVKTQFGTPSGWPTGPINGQVLDYWMDPDIVNDPVWGPQMDDALTSIPTLSLSTDLDNLFDASTGIYVNAGQRGYSWERPASLELIYPSGAAGPGFPDGADGGFQVNTGIRIRGGWSRSGSNAKHAFRLFFRSEYGDAKLEYPLFGTEGVDRFDKVDLRCSQDYSWAFHPEQGPNAFVRDVFARDTQRDMDKPYTRSRYYHLYINGQYWGVFQTQERAEAAFAASYFDGSREDYDTIKSTGSSGGYTIEATDGTMDAWTDLWAQANQVAAAGNDATRSTLYNRMQGLNPDGTRNPSYDVLLDVDNLIDYMMVMLYIGNLDAPISNYLSNEKTNNWYGVRNRYGEEGFKFFSQDAENTMSPAGLYRDRNGPWPAGSLLQYSNPQWIHQQLMSHTEYLVRFGDRVQNHFFNEGVLTPAASIARFLTRAGQIESAIITESARWGDTKRSTPYTKNDWQNAIDEEAQDYLPFRPDIVLDQFRGNGLYPSVAAPTYNQHGGEVVSDFPLTMTAPSGTIYYTLDGSDPRLPGGAVSPDAQQYIGDTTFTALASAGSTWKYLDNGTDQGTGWRQPGFDDSGWASGPAELGYGDTPEGRPEATEVSYGPDPNNKYITTYFRHTFNLTGLPQFDDLTLELVRDDGAVVYINGTEAQRTNMPSGNIDYLTTTPTYIGGDDEAAFNLFSIDPGLLVQGDNIIAVEIHQSDGQSSDISFDLRLTASATAGQDPVLLNESTLVSARVLDGGQWSALSEAQFIVGTAAAAGNLAITELNYNPYNPSQAEIDAGFGDNNSFEFVELQNVSGEVIDLTGVQFVEELEGITFDFTGSGVTLLGPGEFVVVVRNTGAFDRRYGTVENMAGQYAGKLSNGGEWIKLEDAFGGTIQMFEYGDSNDAGWPDRADGNGSTLEVINTGGDYSDPDNWRSSGEYLGSPGYAGQGPYDGIVINEVLSHTDPPLLDSIELHNTSGSEVDIGGWWLSDSNDNYRKYQIPQGTSIAGGQYIVFDESHFNPAEPAPEQVPFALSAGQRDDVWLWQGDAEDNVTYHVDHVEFGAALIGESFGRWVNSAGKSYFYPMTSRTLDPAGPNSGPRIGPELLISEVMYNPGAMPEADDLEFIEVYNPTDQPVALADWRFRKGLDFDFPVGTVLGSHEALVVVWFDPAAQPAKEAAFRNHYTIDASVQIVGGHSDRLNDDGDRVQLQDWDEPGFMGDPPQWITPHPLEDEVDYEDIWDPSTDGGGKSLNRLGSNHWGDEPASWIAAVPTPGSVEMAAEVNGRYIFYNNSAFDTGPGRTDDDAIAPDKTPLLPGGTATFENYTSYARGINGIMVDIADPTGTITAADFEFKVGNDDTPAGWALYTAVPTVTVRAGEGFGGSDRLSLTWPDYNPNSPETTAVAGQWLEVTVLANENTGLAEAEVFYFGNAIGESGNSGGDATVNVQDILATRAQPHPFWNPAQIDTDYDFDRDERVDVTDILIAQANQTWSFTALKLIDLSGGKAAGGTDSSVVPPSGQATTAFGDPAGQSDMHIKGDVVAEFVTMPYLQNMTPQSMVIMWEMDAAESVTVEYGLTTDYGSSTPATVEANDFDTYIFKAELVGLLPATEYHYRLVNDDGPPMTGDRLFTTGTDEEVDFAFGAWGDSQDWNRGVWSADPLEPTTSMMAHMAQSDVDFAFAVGDMATNGASYSDTRNYYLDRVAKYLGQTVPWFNAWGNHDTGSSSAIVRRFADMPSKDWLALSSAYVRDWPHMTVGGYHDLAGSWAIQSSPGVLGPPRPIKAGLVNEYVRVEIIGNHLELDMHAFNADGSYIGVLDSFALGDTPGANDPPSFDGAVLVKPSASSAYHYSDSLSGDATDPDQGDVLTFSKITGPAWLDIAPDGTLSGKPGLGDVGQNTFAVWVTDPGGLADEATLRITVERSLSRVAGRHVFYNNSAFDGHDPGAGGNDDDAIATDKTALLPGQRPIFENYTSYSRGINGIMVDLVAAPGLITAADFEFKVGNDNNPDGWAPHVATPAVAVRPGEGADDSSRVTIIFPDHQIQQQWLQVTVLANNNTGLLEPDVFYFGNAVGETGNSADDAIVNVQDVLATRNAPHPFWDPAGIENRYDFDRDERVKVTDLLVVRANQTWSMTALKLWRQPSLVLITEAATGSPDYVEIQNVFTHEVDTSGWVVAVNGPPGVNDVVTTLWHLPDSMLAGEVLYRSDDSDDVDHYWGADIPWPTRGSGWMMMLDDRGNIADFVGWGYSTEQIAEIDVEINGFEHITLGDAWSGPKVEGRGSGRNSLQRIGNSDHNDAFDWAFTEPQSPGRQNEGLNIPFPGGGATRKGSLSLDKAFAHDVVLEQAVGPEPGRRETPLAKMTWLYLP